MVKAYLLIMSKSGTEKEIINALLNKVNIKDAHIVYGEYDLIAKIEVDDVSQLNDFLLEEIRVLKDVERTSTLIVAE